MFEYGKDFVRGRECMSHHKSQVAVANILSTELTSYNSAEPVAAGAAQVQTYL